MVEAFDEKSERTQQRGDQRPPHASVGCANCLGQRDDKSCKNSQYREHRGCARFGGLSALIFRRVPLTNEGKRLLKDVDVLRRDLLDDPTHRHLSALADIQ